MPHENQREINYYVERSFNSLNCSKLLIDENYLLEAQNRLYYACFYIVKALFLFDKNKLITKKHNNLLGLFNLEYIHNRKEFNPILFTIYRDMSDNRNKADYDKFISFAKDELMDNYNDVKLFVDTIKVKFSSYSKT